RWVVRLYGPNGESESQVFTRLVGTEMNGENEIGYSFGVVDGGKPLLGEVLAGEPAGPTAFASLDWGMSPALTARLDLRAGLSGAPAVALGFNGALGGGLWAVTGARDRLGGFGGAIRLARRIGAQDIVLDLARHGRDDGPGLPQPVREFSQVVSLGGQGRIGLGRLSLPWQARAISGQLRRGGERQALGARMVLPMADWQANLALGAVREGGTPWLGTAALGLTARRGSWRLRSGITAADRAGWKLEGASLSAARNIGDGALALDLDWQTQSGRLGGGVTFSQQLGPFGLSASAGRQADGWRFGIGLTMGLWRGPHRWATAPSGVARSGAIMAEMFVDEDGDGLRGTDESGVAGGRFVVDAALRRETTDDAGRVLIRGVPAGPDVDIETQMSSLEDFTLRPARTGDRLALRPGEVRHVLVPLRPTGSIEVQVLLVAGDRQTPRSGVPVVLRDGAGREVARAVTDFDGFVLFDALPFGSFSAEAQGQISAPLALNRTSPDGATRVLLPPANGV
ncbi:MAG: MSCRAMM family protein, partial [Erythrobacter sp.]